jgi:type 1 fimbriae regulatory protein FimB
MQVDLSTLGPAEQTQLVSLLAKLTPAMPSAATKKAKKSKRTNPGDTIKYLNESEVSRLFSVIKSPRDTAIFRLAYHRGLRATEVGMIQMSDLRMRDERIRFERLKGSTGGEYHLCSSEIRALRAWLKVRGNEPGTLFPSRLGKPISQQMLDVLMKRYCKAAGISRQLAHFHTLKHSCATSLMSRGESLDEVRDHLGHRSIKSTEVYAQFTSARRQARDKRLRDW